MMKKTVKIKINDTIKKYPVGSSLLEISKEYEDSHEEDIILALVDGKLQELFKTVDKDCEISFITTSDGSGRKTYIRGVIILMLRSFYHVLGKDNIKKITIEYSISNGLFCYYDGKIPLDDKIITEVKDYMKVLVEKDIPILKKSIGTDEAIELFGSYKMYDKERLFRYRRVSKTNIYNLDGYEDYYYGYMPPSTGKLKYFDLMLYGDGFLLLLPSIDEPSTIKPFVPQKKLFYTLRESDRWAKMMNIDNVGALNDTIARGDFNDLVLVQESLQEKKIANIAEDIKKQSDKKFIMIAGPSSSGKTTLSHRLSIQLRALGLKPHTIEVDNYFVERDKTPLDEHGNKDFESLRAIEVELFNEHMTSLLEGETVELPRYNFVSGKREYKGDYVTLGEDDILVIEGIHCLNDALSYTLPRESKYKIYISALTQLNIDEHNRIPTTDGRLLRRIVRDARTRDTSAQETIAMWPSVRRGEEKNIFPYQEDADIMFNSALIYELAVIKQYAEALLFGIDRDSKEFVEAKRLLKFLDYFVGAPSEVVPKNSILKEFIGGSRFHD